MLLKQHKTLYNIIKWNIIQDQYCDIYFLDVHETLLIYVYI